jgi:hypothetical protein
MGEATGVEQRWGARKMDEFIAWLTQPAKAVAQNSAQLKPVDPAKAREHIENILKYIDHVQNLADLGNSDAVSLAAGLAPLKTLLKAAKTGAEIAEAAKASESFLLAHVANLQAREEAKMANPNDLSTAADDQRTIADAAVARQYLARNRSVIAYNNPEGTSIPQLLACKVERNFIHKLKFWEKTHELPYAPCDSVLYLLKMSRK